MKQPTFNCLAKIRWLLDAFCKRSKELYNIGEHITVNELVMTYKGEYCKFSQFLKGKIGLKFWVVASLKS